MKKITLIISLLISTVLLTACEADSEIAKRTSETRENISGVSGSNTSIASSSSTSDDEIFPHLPKATVVNIVDGDTIDIVLESGEEKRIRMILIDTPETKGEHKDNPEPFGKEASDFTEALLLNTTVWVEYDEQEVDYYDRTLAYVWVKELDYTYNKRNYYHTGVMFNEVLLQHGLAHVAVYEPNVRYKNRFYVIENKAKRDRVGIWE